MAKVLLDDFALRIADCPTADAVGKVMRDEVARHGYTSSGCGVLTLPGGGRSNPPGHSGKYPFLFQNWAKEWAVVREMAGVSRFAAAEASLIVAEGRKRSMPFSWRDIAAERGLTRIEAEVCNELGACGWRDGLYMPMRGPAGYFAVVGMASPERDLDRGAVKRASLYTIATLAHERAFALSGMASAAWPIEPLTARELECMRWVADGKTDRETAHILGVSPTTVKFFVDRARAKFGARTRAQAVARFVLGGFL